jgi:hypothetical protein
MPQPPRSAVNADVHFSLPDIEGRRHPLIEEGHDLLDLQGSNAATPPMGNP